MHTFFKYIISLSFLLTLSSCNTTDALENAMVAFDKAFIPVFYYTYNNDLESAEKALLVLDSKWKDLHPRFETQTANAHDWQTSFQMVTTWLAEADCAIKDQNADLALIQLDHARYELMDLRRRKGMTYYLDKVWDLEAAIDIVVQTSSDSLLESLEWVVFMPMVYEVEETWNKVLNNTWETEYFNFTPSERLEEMTRKLALEFSVKDFAIAVDYADKCEIERATKEMEAAYLEYIFFFGDFNSMRVIYATTPQPF